MKTKDRVIQNWRKTLFLREEKGATAKGWILDVMNCIDQLGKTQFNLDEVYAFESLLRQKYPNNKHIRDKIRQQLQFLRDKGYLEFVSRGQYKLT
jgi:type II restriction enzyme